MSLDLHAKQEERLNHAVRLLKTVVDITSKTDYCFGHGSYSDVLVLGDLGNYGKDGFDLLAEIKRFLNGKCRCEAPAYDNAPSAPARQYCWNCGLEVDSVRD